MDVVRGVVMVLMALDHIRDYYAPTPFAVEDLARTTPALFFTRWVTHFCAPVFVLLAGTGAFLYRWRGERSRAELAWFLLTRGLWLVVLEFTVLHFVWWFTPDAAWLSSPYLIVYGQVIWAIGVSMVVLAGLVFLPIPVVATLAVAMIVGHNLLDGWSFELTLLDHGPQNMTVAQKIWAILHVPTQFPIGGGSYFGVVYPLVPWIGVMAAGFALGSVFRWDSARRRRTLFALGVGLCLAFVVVRGINAYGDPVPWSQQSIPLRTMMSFMNCEKYPPSLCFLLMTLGPPLIALAALERVQGPATRVLGVFGRVPLFYYVVHLAVVNATAGLYFFLRFGQPRWGIKMYADYPLGYIWSLPLVYTVWAGVILVMYPVCRRFARFKRNSRARWVSYI